jgi:hypothetical protein
VTYKFKCKSGWFYKTFTVVGHRYSPDLDRMSLLFADGGIYEISQWSCYDCKLGSDWALALKKSMEEKAGQPVVVNRDLDAK